MNIKRLLLGKALPNQSLKGEKLSRLWGLPIMASDAISSVAYAVEEILMALIPAMGLIATHYIGFVSLPIIALLIILIFSFIQIINSYPNGGGAYVVSKASFGHRASLLAASCLIVDYIMTVAVSISSAAAAVGAAFPALVPYRVPIALLGVLVITLLNLRGISEASRIFGIPTYVFIALMAGLIVTGFIRALSGNLAPMQYAQGAVGSDPVLGMNMLLFVKAFSAGCSALTGVEAVSNAIPNFKEPSQRNARHILCMLGVIIVFIFGGTSFLATVLKVAPFAGQTVMSQMAGAIFGGGALFYVFQAATCLILLLAANTAYNGLPVLLSILARDDYMPHQFSQRGAKLSFSNGILFILAASAVLLVVFDADTHRLIPFYAVGVFVSFTVSQAGMLVKWIREKQKGWVFKALVNGIGAAMTFVGTIVVFVTKFSHGAWALVVAIPLIMWFMHITHSHYRLFQEAVSSQGYDYRYTPSESQCRLPVLVPIHNMNKAALKTLDYAKEISSNITALHISASARHAEALQKQWAACGIGIPLTVIDAPFRDITQPLVDYIHQAYPQTQGSPKVTVVLTKFVGSGWRDSIFHNQTTFFIRRVLDKEKRVVVSTVPYLYHGTGPGFAAPPIDPARPEAGQRR